MRDIGAGTLLASAMASWAHDGHGMPGNHWHLGDVVAIALVALVAVVWLWRRTHHH
jgi:hypothetical protein